MKPKGIKIEWFVPPVPPKWGWWFWFDLVGFWWPQVRMHSGLGRWLHVRRTIALRRKHWSKRERF